MLLLLRRAQSTALLLSLASSGVSCRLLKGIVVDSQQPAGAYLLRRGSHTGGSRGPGKSDCRVGLSKALGCMEVQKVA
eukprot:682605-Hanusia_phi.AAC.1